MSENVEKTYTDPETGKFVKNNPGGGRPKGQRNYATIYREALEKIAQTQDMTADELETIMVQSGLKQAIKGDYSFYRDTMDRLHGKPKQKTELSGKDITIAFHEAFNKNASTNQSTGADSEE